jgi:hypothetical protein
MRLAGHVKRIGEMHKKYYLENLNGKDNVGDLGLSGCIILKRIFKKSGAKE